MNLKIHRGITIFFFALLSFVISGGASAQTETQRKDIDKAEEYLKAKNYREALKIYLPLIEELENSSSVPYELYYKAGLSYYSSAQEDTFAVPFFRKYLEKSQEHFDVLYFMGNMFFFNQSFDTAIYYYEKLISHLDGLQDLTNTGQNAQMTKIAERQISKCNFGKFLVANPGCAFVESVAGGVNSEFSEYAPVIFPDETKLIFTRRSPESFGNRIAKDGDFYEDLFFSLMNKLSVPSETDEYGNAIGSETEELLTFSYPLNMGQSVNTEDHERAVRFSEDAAKFYLYRKYDIWIAEAKKKQTAYITKNWKKAKPQKIKGVFNPNFEEPSVSVSPHGNAIFFASKREGGFGGLDIYKSELGSDGKWSAPVNLGETINTPYDDNAPFISPDGKTLYFSSKGHSNMGNYDIFISHINGGRWTKPMNLGFPINSSGDDLYFTISEQSNIAFFASNRSGGYGLMDIYKATFPSGTEQTAQITGTILDQNSAPASVNITYYDNGSPEDSLVIFNDESTGEFSFPAKFGRSYTMSINEKKFESYSESFKIPEPVFFCQQYKEMKNITIKRTEEEPPPPVDSIPPVAEILPDSVPVIGETNDDTLSDSASVSSAEQLADNLKKVIESEKKDAAKNLIDPLGVLLYRVQVGSFKKKMSKKAMEKIPNLQIVEFEDGLTRYFSGAFSTYNEAKARKIEMRGLGFRGAFIVAFKNGKRIPIDDALKIQNKKQ